MSDVASLFELSRNHCVAICSVLVPLNFLATLQTLVLTMLNRLAWSRRSIALAVIFAVTMVLHVMTWFVIGVVAVQTFVLLALGSICLGINLWAAFHPQSLRGLLTNYQGKFEGFFKSAKPISRTL